MQHERREENFTVKVRVRLSPRKCNENLDDWMKKKNKGTKRISSGLPCLAVPVIIWSSTADKAICRATLELVSERGRVPICFSKVALSSPCTSQLNSQTAWLAPDPTGLSGRLQSGLLQRQSARAPSTTQATRRVNEPSRTRNLHPGSLASLLGSAVADLGRPLSPRGTQSTEWIEWGFIAGQDMKAPEGWAQLTHGGHDHYPSAITGRYGAAAEGRHAPRRKTTTLGLFSGPRRILCMLALRR